jgi:hypothetical protein
LESLSKGKLDRDSIREIIYRDNLLFRFNRSVYVDALATLLARGSINLINRRYYAIVGKTSSGRMEESD